MEKEIKFRAWNEITGLRAYPILDITNPFNTKDYFIEQFTGLEDKNKVDIYEGDIVTFKANYTNKPCGYMHAIVVIGIYELELHAKNGEIYSANDETDEFPYAHCEIIGNILENPELQ